LTGEIRRRSVQKVKEFTEIRRARREDWSTFCAIKIVKDLWRGFHPLRELRQQTAGASGQERSGRQHFDRLEVL